MSREIEVWADWSDLGGATPMGTLRAVETRGKEVFSIAIGNTDDHLRNHGFLLAPEGWRLAPAYDINPDPDGTGLSLNISETDNALRFDLALEVAPYFRLSSKKANECLAEIVKTAGTWHEVASACHLPRAEQEEMAAAFRRVE